MYIESISLSNFRNYDKLTIELNKDINILYGNNAQGKTNFLEAIYLCSMGRSKRTVYDKEMIKFGENESHIQLKIIKDKKIDRVDMHIRRNYNKGIAINGIAIKKTVDLFGSLYAVIFSPEDLQLVKAGPQERRKFMDMEICQINSTYYYDLQQYYKLLKQRNNLLKTIRKDKSLKKTLFVWDKQLVEYGIKITKKRSEFIKILDSIAKKIYYQIANNKETLEIIYKPNINQKDFLEKLNKNLEKDIINGSTSIGIHKDDFVFFINKKELRTYGSQGQQRTASICTKLAEIEIIRQEKGINPVLLLDDIFSELDKSRQQYLMKYIKNIQTIITATGLEDIIKHSNNVQNISIFNVNNGRIFLT